MEIKDGSVADQGPQASWEQLLQNRVWMTNLTAEIYQNTLVQIIESNRRMKLPIENIAVNSTTKYCSYVNSNAAKKLQESGIQAEYLEHGRGVVNHGFVRVENGNKFVVDFQYLQFVFPINKRNSLSPYMVFAYKTKQDVIDNLKKFRIDEKYYHYYLEELFWDRL